MSVPLQIDDRGLHVRCPACGQVNRVAFERLGASIRCGACKGAISATAQVYEVGSTTDFDRLIARASIPVVVDYWAPWCGPCRMVAPELDKVAARADGRHLIVKVNTDQLTELGERFRIQSIPTMALFNDGRHLSRTMGARPAADIEQFIATALAQG